MTDNEFEKVSYVALEEPPLTWWEWIWGRAEPEIEADPMSKNAKFRVTQQIKNSANSHALMKKHQSDKHFDHTQSVIQTDQKMEDQSSALPSPYQLPKNPPQFPPKQLHPSIAQIRNRKFKTAKDDLDI